MYSTKTVVSRYRPLGGRIFGEVMSVSVSDIIVFPDTFGGQTVQVIGVGDGCSLDVGDIVVVDRFGIVQLDDTPLHDAGCIVVFYEDAVIGVVQDDGSVKERSPYVHVTEVCSGGRTGVHKAEHEDDVVLCRVISTGKEVYVRRGNLYIVANGGWRGTFINSNDILLEVCDGH